MPNMSYVLYENTYTDLYTAYQKMHELLDPIGQLSESEYDYFVKMVKLCDDISKDFLPEITNAKAEKAR